MLTLLIDLIDKYQSDPSSKPLTLWFLTSGGLISGRLVRKEELNLESFPADMQRDVDVLTKHNQPTLPEANLPGACILLAGVVFDVGTGHLYQARFAFLRLQDIAAWYLDLPIPFSPPEF